MHDEYEYWHPITRMHKESELNNLPADHVLAPVVQYSGQEETPRGLQVKPFDWKAWDAGCHAKGICQGYTSVAIKNNEYTPQSEIESLEIQNEAYRLIWAPEITHTELHHRSVAPHLKGIAEMYWQCPHCSPLQKLIQWAQGARLETYNVETRGNKVVLWLKVSSGQWYVLITEGTIQRVAWLNCLVGTAYAVGNYPPQQMPDEIAVALARRFWHRITKRYWSDTPKEVEE